MKTPKMAYHTLLFTTNRQSKRKRTQRLKKGLLHISSHFRTYRLPIGSPEKFFSLLSGEHSNTVSMHHIIHFSDHPARRISPESVVIVYSRVDLFRLTY
jgi:hypothetical protein